jgi:hypothetical protein
MTSIFILRSFFRSSVDRNTSIIADDLTRTIKILCLVTLSPDNDGSQRSAIEDTWGKRCTNLMFVSSDAEVRSDATLKSKPLSWAWTGELLRLAGGHLNNTFDWVLMAEDNTYCLSSIYEHFSSTSRLFQVCDHGELAVPAAQILVRPSHTLWPQVQTECAARLVLQWSRSCNE